MSLGAQWGFSGRSNPRDCQAGYPGSRNDVTLAELASIRRVPRGWRMVRSTRSAQLRRWTWRLALAMLIMGATTSLSTSAASQVSGAPSNVPQVPIAPSGLRPTSHIGDVLDNPAGGHFAAARLHEEMAETENYRVRLAEFLRTLTPAQYDAMLRDDQQWRRLAEGLAYVDSMRRYFDRELERSSDRSSAPSSPYGGVYGAASPDGVRVYAPSQCIGAIVNGECHGSIMPNGSPPMTCHGQMLNGQCTGPMF